MKNKKETKLSWKTKWCDDKSGCWYYAEVPILGWEYVIDIYDLDDYKNNKPIKHLRYTPGVFYHRTADDCCFFGRKKSYAKLDAAKAACEKHLNDAAEKFHKWIKSK